MHRCIRCGTIYTDTDNSILKGCTCGSHFFFFVKSEQEALKVDKMEKELEMKETSLEKEITKQLKKAKSKKAPKKLKIETVRIPREGVYEINIDALMKKKPLIILQKEGIYLIHLDTAFEKIPVRE